MKYGLGLIAVAAITAVAGTAAISDSNADKAALAAVKARQSQMTLYAFNIGLLGGMAKGNVEYDATAASAAAANLASLSKLDQSRLWPQGSDNETLGHDVTEALPKIWAADSDIAQKGMALVEAATAMESAAGGGLDSLRGAMGPLGKSCGSCHETYRQAKN
ncbi:cytochrome c [Rhodobacteraceae bacterium F11138]|nr:cytochrome c [Rhodobacteraceae bacterium F11138]